MTIKEAKKWISIFKKAKFKCIVPDQVIEAMEKLGMFKSTSKRLRIQRKKD